MTSSSSVKGSGYGQVRGQYHVISGSKGHTTILKLKRKKEREAYRASEGHGESGQGGGRGQGYEERKDDSSGSGSGSKSGSGNHAEKAAMSHVRYSPRHIH